MYRHIKHLAVAGLALASGLVPAQASQRGCRAAALEHLSASADGLAIYRQIAQQPHLFEGWIRCDDVKFGLPTAIHESTHVITAETDTFPLVGGSAINRPHEVTNFYPPYRIAKSFETDDLVTTYLSRGRASSSTDFLYLLDEFNAYAHDLNAAVDLQELKRADEVVDHRDGTAAMMAFVAAYAEEARATERETWAGLNQPPVRRTIAALWGQGERVLASACGIPNFGHSDRTYIRTFCTAGEGSAIGELLGRAPVCPTACLDPVPGDLETGDTQASADLPAETPFTAFRRTGRHRQVRRSHPRSAMSSMPAAD